MPPTSEATTATAPPSRSETTATTSASTVSAIPRLATPANSLGFAAEPRWRKRELLRQRPRHRPVEDAADCRRREDLLHDVLEGTAPGPGRGSRRVDRRTAESFAPPGLAAHLTYPSSGTRSRRRASFRSRSRRR